MPFSSPFGRKKHFMPLASPLSRNAGPSVLDEMRWDAVAAGDPRADGAFFYSVVTTGVYCRPSCPARPKRENLRFHATWADAEAAGFRPCKRCKPRGEAPLKAERRAAPPHEGMEGRQATAPITPGAATAVAQRVAAADWRAIGAALDAQGFAVMAGLLDADDCGAAAGLYEDDGRFRRRVHMAQHGYGRGEYKYFAAPLPDVVDALRTALYPPLAMIANRWNEALGDPVRFPPRLASFLKRCHDAGQTRPTPLLLKYGPGDYNCLHQDVYGEHVFPLQAAILLSAPDADFTGGEFILTEQRPRMQSRATVAPLARGDAVIFAVRHRPVHGARRSYRVNLRHGVSTVSRGERYTLGIIFHDAT